MPRRSMALKFERTAHANMRKRQSPLKLTGDFRDARQRLPMQFFQQGFVGKRIDLTDSALHKQKNAVFRFARQMNGLWRQRTARCTGLTGQQVGQSKCADSVERLCEHLAP